MSSFLDAQPVKEEEEDAGLGWVLVGHPLRWPVTDLNLQIFLVKSAKEDMHIYTDPPPNEGNADEQSPLFKQLLFRS